MTENKYFTFEKIFKQNENRIHYQMQRLGISDPNGEFFSEGIVAMWTAYKKYEPERGPMSTYFNYMIRYRLLDLIRKKVQEKEKEHALFTEEITSSPLPEMVDEKQWEAVFSGLTRNQRKWVYYFITREMTLREIAEREGVSVEAVKSWGKQARKKLRKVMEEQGES